MMLGAAARSRATASIGEDGDAQAHRQPQGSGNRRCMARITASVYTSHVPLIGVAIDRQDAGAVLAAAVRRLRAVRRWFAAHKPDVIFLVYNDHATAFSLEHDPDLRDRRRRRVPAGRRRLGPAAGAEGDRPPGARRAHRAERDPGRLRPHHRQQDGRRPRPDRAAQPDVRPAARPGRARSSRSWSTCSSTRCRRAGAASSSARRSARRSRATTSRSTSRSGAPAA